ncbi:B12-binding domain-containing radical SAM protein [archaeon]|jgi:anaerobic magnesium-protoporphyrin IX monomethyl ester cyclase|nr:B12-binding domain-containing radical SAM protein [archaeon]MBT4242097.1 B12-binding domain-containing radical SAM protein [archaeon]MBT4417785.1 B12-binding domain-containing radical SAM protein [archaeon]
MRITLISTATYPSDQGIRTISSVLKKAGHEVKIIFLAFTEDYTKSYPKQIFKQILNLSKDADLIGINSFASTAPRAIQVLNQLKKYLPNKPIVWGGIHATISPEQCINHCNIVCVGEAEETIIELAEAIEKNKPIDKISNLWIKNKKTNKIIKNPVRLLIDDLDSLPPVDYDIQDHYILDKNKIRKFTEYDLGGQIFFLTGRGCPYGCAYCSNDLFNKLYEGKRKKIVRWHSPDYIINEVINLKNKFKSLKYFDIRDDTFSMRSSEQIKDFCKQYKEKVNMRFKCLADPHTVTHEKIKALVDAGCTDIIIGIQGVERVNKDIYHRNQTDNQVIDAAKIINKYKDKLAIMYDVITTNPYEKPEDVINMIHLLQKLPKPYFLSVNNLVFFTSTPLYCKAKEEGIIKKEEDSAANLNYWDRAAHIKLKKKNMYLNLILNLMRGVATKNRYGLMPNTLINYLLKKEKIRRNLKNTTLTKSTLILVGFSDSIREKILKPTYRSLPLDFKAWYDKVRYRV